MSDRPVFDTWAWLEVLKGSPPGAELRRKYLEAGPVDTVDVTLAEVSIRMVQAGQTLEDVVVAIDTIMDATELSKGSILSVGPEEAKAAGVLRRELRKKTKKEASLVDAVVLGAARARGARLVSCDRAYHQEPDVDCEGGEWK